MLIFLMIIVNLQALTYYKFDIENPKQITE